ncbi:MAG TPA: hypothetical protein VM143_17035 [Acidimicrobiales bacterium]|nr:hypothetical protein [Acidimicrobiales bacterium]
MSAFIGLPWPRKAAGITVVVMEPSCPAVSPSPSLFDRIFRNPKSGDVVIAQLPNVPLGIYLAATAARLALHPRGTMGTIVSIVGALALAWWAVGEIGWGESLFRRLLGAVVLAGVVVSWAGRLF